MRFSKSYLCAASIIIGLTAACSTQIGGDGQMSEGSPISVIQQIDMSAVDAVSTIDILSPDGWSCRSRLRNEESAPSGSMRDMFPMSCSNGATGTIVITWDNLQKRQLGAFKLSNGKSGRIVFDFKRR